MSDRDRRDELRARREEWLRATRIQWYRVMRPLGRWLPWDIAGEVALDDPAVADYFQPAPALRSRHVRHCKVVSDRAELLRTCVPKRGIVAEVGTDKGDFADMILRLSSPAELHIIDKTLRGFRRDAFASGIERGTVRLHEADSVAALGRFADGSFDWIYIVADHSYGAVRRDIDEARKKVKPEGLLVLNDYTFWSHREFMAYGVVQAVNEFCLAQDWELLYLALHPEMHLDVALRRF